MEQVGEEGMSSTPHSSGLKKRWKKNLRQIPDGIALKVKKSATADIAAACTRKISAQEIIAGRFKHVGIEVQDGEVTFPKESFLPNRKVGKFSERNIDGREIVR